MPQAIQTRLGNYRIPFKGPVVFMQRVLSVRLFPFREVTPTGTNISFLSWSVSGCFPQLKNAEERGVP